MSSLLSSSNIDSLYTRVAIFYSYLSLPPWRSLCSSLFSWDSPEFNDSRLFMVTELVIASLIRFSYMDL